MEVEWPEERCLQLIEEFKNRPVLWDKMDLLFYKKNIKSDYWYDIGRAMDIAPEICRHKMNILLSSFRREKSKMKINYGFIAPYISPWFGFEPLSFLLNNDGKRKRKRTKKSLEMEDDILLVSDKEDTKPIPDPGTSEMCDWEVRPEKSSKISVRDDLVSTASSRPVTPSPATPLNNSTASLNDTTTSQSNSIDEIKYFSNFIASKMMKYSSLTKNVVQQEICNIIFKADQNFYEKKQKPQPEHASPTALLRPQENVCEQQPSSSDGDMKLYYSDSD